MANNDESYRGSQENDSDSKKEEWSNSMCIQISLEDTFPANVKDLTIQKAIINRFLNFYLSGKVQKGLIARDLLFAVIAIMPYSLHSEELIWEDCNYSDDGTLFYLSPEDKLKAEVKDILTKHNHQLFQNKSEQRDMSDSEVTIDEVIAEGNVESFDISGECELGESEQVSEVTDKTELTSNEINNDKSISEDNQSLLSDDVDDSLLWFRKKSPDRNSNSITTNEYGPVENSAFCISCNKLLDKWDTDMVARIKLKYFFGAAALSLMRTIVKSDECVIRMFTGSFPTIVICTSDCISYFPPNERCVKKCYKIMRKEDRKTSIMFAKLVINSFILNSRYNKCSDRLDTGGIKNILNATLLAHAANFGMDIIGMLQEVASRTSNFHSLFKRFRVDETAASWDRVNDFFKKYMCKSSYHPTCHWARIIDREKFSYLTCVNNYKLAVLIAVSIEKLSNNNNIWNARWVKTGSNLETYQRLGLKIYKESQVLNLSCFFKFIDLDQEIVLSDF